MDVPILASENPRPATGAVYPRCLKFELRGRLRQDAWAARRTMHLRSPAPGRPAVDRPLSSKRLGGTVKAD